MMTVENIEAAQETARLRELDRLGVRLHGPSADLDLVARAAAALFGVPIALVSLVDAQRQWFLSAVGLRAHETPRSISLCSVAIESPDRVLVIPDATMDSRFSGNSLVAGEPWIRFYAGAPLISSRGVAIGALCVIDRRARTFSADESAVLRSLASLIMRFIEHSRHLREALPLADGSRGWTQPGVAVFGWNSGLDVTRWSSAAEAMLGWSAAEVLGRFPPFLLDADRASFSDECRDVLAGSGDSMRRCTIRAKNGEQLRVAIGAARSVAAGNTDIEGLSTVEIVDARIEAERRLAMFESAVVNSTDAVVVTAASPVNGVYNRIIYVNDAFTRLTGHTAADVVGQTPRMLQGPQTDPAELSRVSAALARCEAVSAELVNYRKDGSQYWVECSISPVLDAAGTCIYFMSIARAITARRALEKYEQDRSLVLEMAVRNEPLETQLARIVMLLKNVIPGSAGTVMLLQGDHFVVAAADPELPPAYVAAINGTRIGPAVGSSGTAMYTGEAVICGDVYTDARWDKYRNIAASLGLRACWSIPFFATSGEVSGAFALNLSRPVLPTARQLQLVNETARFAALVVDRHRDRQRLEHMALYDGLTNLPNRKLVEAALTAAISRAQAAGCAVAVGILDIDRFKAINDAFGHHVGDRLLRAIADRLSSSMRQGDAVGRMAGDEFLVLFPDLGDIGVGMESAMRLLDQFIPAFAVEGLEISVRPSLGLAFFPAVSEEMPDLFQAADKAMYAAKSRGGGLHIAPYPGR